MCGVSVCTCTCVCVYMCVHVCVCVHVSVCLLQPHDVRKAVLKAIIAGLLGESETRHKTKNHLRAYLILLEACRPHTSHGTCY